MMGRRDVAWMLGGALAAACGGARRAASPSPPGQAPFNLEPIVDLIPAAGLVWLVHARPNELLATPAIARAISTIVPESRFQGFAERLGGVDVRRAREVAVAGYPQALLSIARVSIDPSRVEAAFEARALEVDGRAVEAGVTRVWGKVRGESEHVAVFDTDALAIEYGRDDQPSGTGASSAADHGRGPLRAAVYFATGKLKRSLPALRAEPLAAAAQRLGPAPLRAFVPGPFGEPWATGLAGLLRATTAVGAAMVPVGTGGAELDGLKVRVVLTGAWGGDAPAAAQRLEAAFQVLAADALGRLTGLDRGQVAAAAKASDDARVSGDPTALELNAVVDPMVVARGLHAATDAEIGEIMAF